MIILTVLLTRTENPNADGNAESVPGGEIVGNHLYKRYCDAFIADALIPTEYDNKANVMFAEKKMMDEKKILKLFFKGQNPKRSENNDDSISYDVGNYEKSAYLARGTINYSAEESQHLALATENFSAKYDDTNLLPDYDEVYKQKELGFMSREAAVQKVHEVLKTLDLNVSDDVEVYAMDYKTMQKYQDEKIKEDPDSAMNYTLHDTLTEDDECYILFFTSVYNQTPVTHDSYLIWDGDRAVGGSNLCVYLSKNGIIKFESYTMYTVLGTAESPSRLLSPEQAVDMVYDIYNSMVTDEKVTVKEVNFEYIPIPYSKNENEVKMTPAWSVVLSSDIGDTKGIITHRHINAVTGDEIK